MEDNLKNALIIISAIIIAAIFIHGFWTIRKNKNPYKLKAKPEDIMPEDRGFDGSGFDQVGVSKPRVVGDNPLSEHEIPKQPAPSPESDAEPIPKDLMQPSEHFNENEPSLGDMAFTEELTSTPPLQGAHQSLQSRENIAIDSAQAEAEIKVHQPIVEQKEEAEQTPAASAKPVYQEPVIQQKASVAIKAEPKKRKKATSAAKRNQLEINFDDQLNEEPMPSMTANGPIKAPTVEPEVLIISVVMPEGHSISGAALLPTLLTLGMRYGEMNIFHRHQDNAGNGKVTFSLANMLNPGTFDLDAMETFTTQGVSLFMTLPNASDPFEVFQLMLGAAKQLALEFHGQLLDDKRSVMTMQTEQHYTSKIREFERKNSIAAG